MRPSTGRRALPDPNDPAAALTLEGRRAIRVRDFLAAFDMPQPRFDPGDEEQRRQPAIAYRTAEPWALER